MLAVVSTPSTMLAAAQPAQIIIWAVITIGVTIGVVVWGLRHMRD